MSSLHVAILTVSDTASNDGTKDKSGPTISQILLDHHIHVQDYHYIIVPDNVAAIQSVVQTWVHSGQVDWIITTGGTGFGVRDTTPEAITPLLTRSASGLVHLLLSSSLKHTPLAALSRPVAGTIRNTLVTTLPGSVKAVTENLEALFTGGVVDHAVELIKGGTGREVHVALAQEAGGVNRSSSRSEGEAGVQQVGDHHHHHHHGHEHHPPQPRSAAALSHDPSAPASARHRNSPYPLISLEAALKIIDGNITPLHVETRFVDHNLRGYILAEDVYAPQDAPPTATTSVDGYALRSTDQPGTYDVVTPLTHPLSTPLPPKTIYRINTGGPLPVGTDTVIMVEDTKLVSTFPAPASASVGQPHLTEGEEKEVETLVQVPAGENVRKPGSDVKKGDAVMKKGERILSGGGEIGTLAFVGRSEVSVFKKPIVALLSTGNELVDLQKPGGSIREDHEWGGIFDTNRPSLRAALEGLGYEVVDLGIVPDQISSHVSAIEQGLKKADVLLTTGGTSMGPTDLLKPVIERSFNGTVHFGRVTIKPGKPTTFATIPWPVEPGSSDVISRKPVFALPGNPASALVTFYVFVLPALRRLGGWNEEFSQLPRVKVKLQTPLSMDPRTEFHRVIVRLGKNSGVLEASSTGGQRSSRVASLSGANGLVIVPPLAGGGIGGSEVSGGQNKVKTRLEVGELVDAILIGEIQMV